MKALTKTLAAASLALGTAGANAAIVNDKTYSSEAFLSVYDSSHQGTFTLDLGVTLSTLVSNINNAAYSLSYDLSGLADWTAFKAGAGANLSTSKYIVATGGNEGSLPVLASTGNMPFVSGGSWVDVNTGVNKIAEQATLINLDAAAISNSSTYAVQGQFGQGHHGEAGTLWQTPLVGSDTQAIYGNAIDFWMADIPDFTSSQVAQFAGQWKLDGDTLTYGAVSAVPVPAAVWLFGSAMLGMLGISRRKTAA